MIKGVGIVNEDGSSDDTIYWNNVRFACQLMGEAGFIQVDTFSKNRGHNANDVINSINQGRGVVLYRGRGVNNWYTPFAVNVALCENGQKLPIIASITCQTLTLNPGESMVGEAWLKVGSVERPKGAVAFFGNTHSASDISPLRGACTRGFFRSFFSDTQLGKACLAAKESIYARFGNQAEYEGFNLLGDPELSPYTRAPKLLVVEHPTNIRAGTQNVRIRVNREGSPLGNALVCLMKESEVYKYGYTNSSGEVVLSISPQTPGTLVLTVTAKNSFPFEAQITVLPPSGAYLTFQGITCNDLPPRGNGNGIPNPGEEIWAKIALKNSGDASANGVTAQLKITDPNCFLLDSLDDYGSIPPESIRENIGYFIFRLNNQIPDNYPLNFTIVARDNQGNYWNIPFNLLVRSGKLSLTNVIIKDTSPGGNGNNIFEPGEAGFIQCGLKNIGGDVMENCRALLRNYSEGVKVIDSLAFFGNINPNEERYNNLTPFSLTISPACPGGSRIRLKLFYGRGVLLTDSQDVILTLGGAASGLPTGPDAYGYYLYDNTDIASGRAPTYRWIEISRQSGAWPVPGVTNANDTIVTLRLPFTFRYYGVNYDSISISSNGFVCLARSNYRSGNNTPVPSPQAPPRGVFPFWDDLDTRHQQGGQGGEVYHYYDAVNNYYIIEYWNVRHYQQRWSETFEIIFYDPRFYPTPTGDGEILFQYYSVADASSCTVGHQDNTQTCGLQYLYNGTYDPNAAPLVAGRAIKLTTYPPQSTNSPWVTLERLLIDDSRGGNGNGILEPGESILLVVYLKNRGTVTAANLSGKLRRCDLDLTINDSLFDFGNISPNQEVNNASSPYRFTISNSPTDTVLSFLLYLQGDGYSNALFFSLGLGRVTAIAGSKKAISLSSFPTILRADRFNKLVKGGYTIYDYQGRRVRQEKYLPTGIYFIIIPPKERLKFCIIR